MRKRLSRILLMAVCLTAAFGGNFVAQAAQEENAVKTELVFANDAALTKNYRIPSMVLTKHGTLVAFCNDRVYDVEDAASVQSLCMSRKAATDQAFSDVQYLLGRSWEDAFADRYDALSEVPNEEKWVFQMGAAVYDEQNDKIMCFVNPSTVDRTYVHGNPDVTIVTGNRIQKTGEGRYKFAAAATRLTGILESDDDGLTWKFREALVVAKEAPYTVGTTHGAAAGIQLKHGEHAGRLVIPSRYTTANVDFTRPENAQYAFNIALYSDDGGRTWIQSGPVQAGTGEGTLCEMPDGTLYYNSRAYYNDGKRRSAISTDGGQSWKNFQTVEGLVEPLHGISSTVVTLGDRAYRYAFTGLDFYQPSGSLAAQRQNLTVWLSTDATAWVRAFTVDAGRCGYNCARFDESTGTFYILYEKGGQYGPNTRGIAVATVDYAAVEAALTPPEQPKTGCRR